MGRWNATTAGHPTRWAPTTSWPPLALAADPDEPLGADAVPVEQYLASVVGDAPRALPGWYMPSLASVLPGGRAPRRAKRWQVVVVALVVGAFVAVDATGLCSTYGLLTLA